MIYLWVKSAHIAAVLLFIGGLLLLAVTTSRWPLAGSVLLPHEKRIGMSVLRWDRQVTIPAMAMVWGFGLGLAVWGGWMGQAWLFIKLGLVIALSFMHGVLSATLRKRLQCDAASQRSWLRHSPAAIAALSVAIAVLVTLKP